MYALGDTTNPFGVYQSLDRDTYEGLEGKVGGAAFANTSADAYVVGTSTTTNDGIQRFKVDVIEIAVGDSTVDTKTTSHILVSAILEVNIPSL